MIRNKVLSIGLFLISFTSLKAQINPTDGCGAAPTLSVNGSCVTNSYTLSGGYANTGLVNGSCATAGNDKEDGWYKFVATAASTTIDLTGNTLHSVVVFSSGCPPTGEVACSQAAGGSTASVTFATTVGATYYVQVHRHNGGNNVDMTGTICIYSPVAPANDNPCSATVVAVGASCSFSSYTNAGATNTTGVTAPGCASYSGGDVWFQMTVPPSGNLIIDSNTGGITDGGMALYTGTCGALTLVACNDDGSANGLMPMISQPGLTPGSTVWVRFWEYGNDNNGTFQLCAYAGASGSGNDDPCSATTVAVGSSCSFTTYSNAGTSASSGVPAPGCASYSGGDVWFQVTVPPSGDLTFDSNTGVMLDGGMAIYSGTCSSLTLIACNDDGSTNGAMPMISSTTLTPGATIWIRFWEFSNDNNGTFQLCVYEPTVAPPATNITCGGMTPICSDTPTTFSASTGGTAASVANPLNNYGCLFTSPNPSWYYIKLQTGGTISIDMTAGSDIDFALWGPFANLADALTNCTNGYGAPIDCSYSISATEQANVTGAVAGQVYVLLVTNYADVAQVIDLNSGTGNTALTDCSIVLPIELVSISATAEYGSNTLHWTTLSEIANDFFVVERSVDGSNFVALGTVDGSGNTTNKINYEFVDRSYFADLSYYRLKQVDYDGTPRYSSIVSVNRTAEVLSVYPNPTSGAISLQFPASWNGKYTIKFRDNLGRESEESVEIAPDTKTYTSALFEKLPAGIYFVEVTDEHGTLMSLQKIIKT